MGMNTWNPQALDAANATFPREHIATDGHGTNLRHRQHEYAMANIVPAMRKCRLCGGECDRRQDAHNLCVERANRGMDIPVLRALPECGCHACNNRD